MEHLSKTKFLDQEALAENIPGGLHQCVNNEDFLLLNVSRGFLELIGYSREELTRQFHDHYARIILPEDLGEVRETVRQQLSHGNTIELEYRIRCRDGKIIWILGRGNRVTLPDGTETLYCILLDNTKQHEEREKLRLSLERHEIIMNQVEDIIFEWDIRQDTLKFSGNWKKKFGYDPISQNISREIPISSGIHPKDVASYFEIMKNILAGVPYSEAEFRIRDSEERFIWCRIRATTQYDDTGRPIKAVGVIVDIDADKKQKQCLEFQARRDGLTGLLNKSAAKTTVEEILQKEDPAGGVLLMIDVDNFKAINDRYGHLTGDVVLSGMGETLHKLSGCDDVAARIGGDEFLVYLPGASMEEARDKALAINRALKEISIYEEKGMVSCSIGAADFPETADNFLELYRYADQALYRVKNQCKGGFAKYSWRD